MELTKFEKRVMHPKYRQRCLWYFIVPGVVFIATGIFVGVYGHIQSKQVEAKWTHNMDTVSSFVPNTESEIEIYQAAIRSTDAARIGWTGFVEEKSIGTAKLFLIVGSFLVGHYFNETKHKKLIEKIGAPNQAL
jgi:hypothetical protein